MLSHILNHVCIICILILYIIYILYNVNEEVIKNETVLHIFYPLPPEPDVKRV